MSPYIFEPGYKLADDCNTCKLCHEECKYGCTGTTNRDCLHPESALNPYVKGNSWGNFVSNFY